MYITDRFIDASDSRDSLLSNQLQQAWSRILFGSAGLLYIWLHGEFLIQYKTIFLTSAALYFTYNILTLYTIRRTPHSVFRMLFGPLLDVWVVSLAMLIDGGQASGLYLVLFIIIFGNAMRFGNSMLLYGQTLSIIGIISVSGATLFALNLELDETLLFLQCAALIIIPAYVIQIKNKASRAIRAKQAAENATFGLLDHGPLPAFTFQLDPKGVPRILYANLAMQHVYRDSPVNLIGEQVDVVALMEDGNEVIRACQHVFSEKVTSEPLRFYIRGRDANDHILQLMGQSMRLHWHGKWIGVCFLLDVTQSEAARNELEHSIQNSYVSTLVTGIVHDFRNILTSIIGTAEVMSFSTKDENVQKQLKLIIEAGDRGSNMVTHLLELGKSEHKHDTRSSSPSLIEQSLSSIIGLMRIQLPPHIQLHLKIINKLPTIPTSITEIEHIVTNLINNSAQAIPKTGHISVKLSNAKLPSDDSGLDYLHIHVHDDGSGIAEEHIADVTKPFWTSRQDEGGTGLGLAMVQRMVRKNSGSMEIRSTIGKGTSIHIYLPAEKVAAVEEKRINTPASKPVAISEASLTPDAATLLLVDDVEEVLAVHKAQLERMGHEVFTANDGDEGLERFREHADAIELVVTDYKMPQMDGLELSAAIREEQPDIPILIITGYGEEQQLKKTRELGIHILNKPATFKKLAHTLAVMQGKAESNVNDINT